MGFLKICERGLHLEIKCGLDLRVSHMTRKCDRVGTMTSGLNLGEHQRRKSGVMRSSLAFHMDPVKVSHFRVNE